MFGLNKTDSSKAPESELARSLRDEKARSDLILNSIADGVILIDTNRAIQLLNAGGSKIIGWEPSDAIGLDYKMVLKLVDGKNEPYTQRTDPFERIFIELATIRDNSANLVTKSGRILALSLSVSPLVNSNNEVTGAVGIFRDISEERKAEQQRAEFISTASHEMRTPVAAIEGYLALAMNERVARIDSKARDYLQKAHTSTQHLGKLFQDLLTSAKAEDGRLQNHPTVVEMGDFLQQLTEDVRFTAEKKNLLLNYMIGASDGDVVDAGNESNVKLVRPLYYVHVDSDRLHEVIINLFDNAIKYTESGKITIGLAGDDTVVQIRVQDTGSGIPADDIPHLFEKFYRVDSSTTRTIGGTGLGLFICRKIVELYDGRIWVESTLGQGSIFYINLPRLSTEKARKLQAEESTKRMTAMPEQNATTV